MKTVIRLFFKGVRALLTPLLLIWEWSSTRTSLSRDAETQSRLDNATSNLTLYQFKTCPFCIKVRIAAHQLGIKLDRRDAQFDTEARKELAEGGGEIKVPCLRIKSADQVRWLYESDDIVNYLSDLVAQVETGLT